MKWLLLLLLTVSTSGCLTTWTNREANVYRAEWKYEKLIGSGFEILHTPFWQIYVKEIQKSDFWKDQNGAKNIEVLAIPDNSARALTSMFEFEGERYFIILLPPWAHNEITVLHELAHVMSPNDKVPSHGKQFTKNFLKLLEEFQSDAHRDLMKQIYRDHKIKIAP